MIDLNTPLIKLLPHVEQRTGQRVGIELEYEGFSSARFLDSDLKVNRWYLERDPSLRGGGMELISHVLMPGHLDSAYKEATAIIRASTAKANIRCGVHVHLNMSDVTLTHLWNTIVLYILAEPSIFKQFADGREGSHFCVPLWSNAMFAQTLYNDMRHLRVGYAKMKLQKAPKMRRAARAQPGMFHVLDDDLQRAVEAQAPIARVHDPVQELPDLGLFHCIKYSALNFRPLTSLGTIEFRQHPATTDMKKVDAWVQFLMGLRDLAGEYKDPLDILDEYEESGLLRLQDTLQLDQVNVDDLDQEEAEDVATMAAGHIAAPWTDFEWEL